jgi:hypothetical protein
LEGAAIYTVKITPEAEYYYYEILEYFYKYHSRQSGDRKSAELLDLAIALEINPQRGTIEGKLKRLEKSHRFILYHYTFRKAVKIIYFIDELQQIVYITDFFPCTMNDQKINKRSK